MVHAVPKRSFSRHLLFTTVAFAALLFAAGCESEEVRQCKLDCSLAEATICGADGKDYLNECHAGCAGTSAQYDGPCRMSDAK